MTQKIITFAPEASRRQVRREFQAGCRRGAAQGFLWTALGAVVAAWTVGSAAVLGLAAKLIHEQLCRRLKVSPVWAWLRLRLVPFERRWRKSSSLMFISHLGLFP